MNSGLYIKSVFDAVSEKSLQSYVKDYETTKEIKRQIFDYIPQRATENSAGYDLGVLNDETIQPHESKLISFGHVIRIENPTITGVILPRSSLAKKRGLVLAGDPYYVHFGSGHEVISVKFINYTNEPVTLKAGDKIAQVVFIKYPTWIIGDFEALCDIESSCSSILPDPLDETFMSPMLDKNIELNPYSAEPYLYGKVDQIEKLSYKFQSPISITIDPGKVVCVMTGLRVKMDFNQVFLIKPMFDNSSLTLANKIGVVDADYYDNPDNGGEIGILVHNRGNISVTIDKGDTMASGALYYFERADGDENGGQRVGGFGSTDK